MATVKLQNGRVVLSNGKVSCDCCIECIMPSEISSPIIITREQYEALGRGGSGSFLASANLTDCDADPEYYDSTTMGISFNEPTPEFLGCVASGPFIGCFPPPNSCVGNSTLLYRGKRGDDYVFTIAVFSNGGYSGPNFYLTRPGSGDLRCVTNASLSVTIDGENIPCEFFITYGCLGCEYSLQYEFDYVSNP